EGLVECRQPDFFGSAAGKGKIYSETRAFARARFVGVAPEVGVLGVGFGVEGDEEDVAAGVEDVLGAVAVVVVDVEDGDAGFAGHDEALGGGGGVVEVAEASAVVGAGVVAGGTA